MGAMKTILQLNVVTACFALVCAAANGQQVLSTNPSNFPECQPKNSHDTSHFHNCFSEWGDYHGSRIKYKGDFAFGKFHGYGRMYDRNTGELIFEGYFAEGRPKGTPMKPTNIESAKNHPELKSEKREFAERTNSSHKSNVVGSLQINPNSLPPCPNLDYSKNKDVGVGGRTEKWTNCWGRYRAELSRDHKDDVLEGEWGNGLLHGLGIYSFANGDKYSGELKQGVKHGFGTWASANGDKYVGEFKDDMYHGQGTATSVRGYKYIGQYKENKMHGLGEYTYKEGHGYSGEWFDGRPHGRGVETFSDGREPNEGVFANGKFIRAEKINSLAQKQQIAANSDRAYIDREPKQLAEDSRKLNEDKRQREDQRRSQRLNIAVNNTQPSSDGTFTINVQANADIASLLINGEEQGGRASGDYIVKKVARAGQETKFTILATDINGNTDTKTITVSRQVVDSKVVYSALNPTNIKRQPERDAVAVVIGIADYRSLPKAEFANDDARTFYDYTIRALGVKPENIKLLVDGDAEEVEILKTFRTWLPSRVKSTTDVYVYYSGHGLPAADGQSLYILPQRADRDLIEDTAIQLSKINTALQAANPRSVTIFIDACYSGQSRSGETLVASARPVTLKSDKRLFPDNFTVITASQADQISSSSPDLKHGIFSYYLMKGMEGDADANKDGRITLGEMHAYLVENVGRQAGMMSRKQEPQLIGDAGRLLVGR